MACNSNLRKEFFKALLNHVILITVYITYNLSSLSHFKATLAWPDVSQALNNYMNFSSDFVIDNWPNLLAPYQRVDFFGCFITSQCSMSALLHSALVKYGFERRCLKYRYQCTWAAILPLVIPRSERTTSVCDKNVACQNFIDLLDLDKQNFTNLKLSYLLTSICPSGKMSNSSSLSSSSSSFWGMFFWTTGTSI